LRTHKVVDLVVAHVHRNGQDAEKTDVYPADNVKEFVVDEMV
jgi:hypothetical protein